jgi:hypothetical protein
MQFGSSNESWAQFLLRAAHRNGLTSGRTAVPEPTDWLRIIDQAPDLRSLRPSDNPQKVRRLLMTRNIVRWNKLQREVAFFRKQMKKMGFDPDDLHWLL